jgi:hypothetical protein
MIVEMPSANRVINFYNEKYESHFGVLFSVEYWLKAMGDGPINKHFGEDRARLTKDLLFGNEKGSLKSKIHLRNDIGKVIFPTLVDKVGYLSILHIEYEDDTFDLVVENLTRNLFLNVVLLEAHNPLKFLPYTVISDEGHYESMLMRDVAFDFSDLGLAVGGYCYLCGSLSVSCFLKAILR